MGLISNLQKLQNTFKDDFSNDELIKLNESLSDNSINKLIEIGEMSKKYKSNTNISLPIEPYNFIWIITPCRMDLPEAKEKNLHVPETCTGIYSDLCEHCELNNGYCVNTAYVEKKWFHLDSPYLSLVLNEWENLAFEDEDKAIQAAKNIYNPKYVDMCQEKYRDYLETLASNNN